MNTSRSDRLSGRLLARPRALLLDFGGVVAETHRNPDWETQFASHVHAHLLAAGVANMPHERVKRDIIAGCKADSFWKDAMSRPYAPRELTHAEFWGDFVAGDWPAAARAALLAEASELCRVMGHMRSRRTLRAGIIDLLNGASAHHIPVGIVSNALSGQVHLDFLDEHDLTGRFAVIVHSDSAGVRKPNPGMIFRATASLGVAPANAWYVGDNLDRDVLCGIRAGVGANILMEAPSTWDPPYDLDIRPDAIVPEPSDLCALLMRALQETTE